MANDIEPDDRARRLANVLVTGMNAKALIAAYYTDEKPTDGVLFREVLMDLAVKLRRLGKDDYMDIRVIALPEDIAAKAERLHDALAGANPSAPVDDALVALAADCCGLLDVSQKA
jgi:hypothetical protein